MFSAALLCLGDDVSRTGEYHTRSEGSGGSAYQAGSPVAMRLSISRKAFSIASLWYISYMS